MFVRLIGNILPFWIVLHWLSRLNSSFNRFNKANRFVLLDLVQVSRKRERAYDSPNFFLKGTSYCFVLADTASLNRVDIFLNHSVF